MIRRGFDPVALRAAADEARDRHALSSIVGRRTKLQRAGREWKGLCPFHSEKTPSFHVNDTSGLFHCFGCAAAGDAIDFVMASEGLRFSFTGAIAPTNIADACARELARRLCNVSRVARGAA